MVELKYVSKCTLEALKVLHGEGYVHTGKARTEKILCELTESGLKTSKLRISLTTEN
jgi:hypothetical protein